MSQSLVQNYVHVVFATKGRRDWLAPAFEDDLHGYLGGIARNRKSILVKANGTENHIHLVIRLHPDVALSHLVRDLKASSSSWMKQRQPEFAWQGGYGGFSCSMSQLEPLLHYVDRQKVHHRIHSYDDEMSALAKRWGFQWAWDPETGEQSWRSN